MRVGRGVRVCNYTVKFIKYIYNLKANKMSTDLHDMHEEVIPKSRRFTVEEIAKTQKYLEKMNLNIEYERDFPAIDEAIEIMRDFEIEISNEIKHRQFIRDIKYRMSEIVRFIHNEDLSKVAQSRIDGINYDLNEYLNSLTDD